MDTALLIADLNRVYSWDLVLAGPGGAAQGSAAQEGAEREGAAQAGVSAEDAVEIQLAEKINTLIQRDFGALVQLLYRIDVQEQKLRRMLETNNGEDAGRLIARLIMERQWQKIESRRRYRQDDEPGESDEERW
jgi:hypothetical protein